MRTETTTKRNLLFDLYATITNSDGASISEKEFGINTFGNLRLSKK